MDKIGLHRSPPLIPKPKPLVPGRVDGRAAVPAPPQPDGVAAAQREPPQAPAEQAAPAPEESFRSLLAVDLVTASVLLALGVLVIAEGVRMGIGWGPDGPEGGFVPFWLAVILTLCSASVVVRALRRNSRERFATRQQLSCVLQVMLPATVMILLVPWIGLYVAGGLYTVLYMRFGGRHSWALSVALPIVVLLLFFLVFEKWFLVPLPKGPLENWLGY